MPVPDSYQVARAGLNDFHLLESDIYQMEIADVEMKEAVLNQFTGKEADQFIFHLKVVSETDRAAYLRLYTSAKFFDGGAHSKPSRYYEVLKAVFDYYFTDKDLDSATDALSGKTVNSLIGKQMRVTVVKEKKPDATERNRITTFMPIKKELPAIGPDEIYVKPEDMPF